MAQKAETFATATPVLGDYALGSKDPTGTPLTRNFTFASVRDLLQANLTTAVASTGYDISTDVKLRRDAAGTLALKNGVNPQTLYVYNTFTDASNYERGVMKFNSNVLIFGFESAGTGGSRDIVIKSNTTNVSISPSDDGSFAFLNFVSQSKPVLKLRNESIIGFTNGSDAKSGSYQVALQGNGANGFITVIGSTTSTGAPLRFIEQTAPSAPPSNSVLLYSQDNGSGKTQLMALFPTGAAQQIAIEP